MNDGAMEKSLHDMLRDGSLYHRAPPHLLARVRTGLPREPQPRMARYTWLALSSGGALAWAGGGLAGIVFSAMVFGAFTLVRPPQGDALEQAIVSSHVRALLSQHSIDVVSTDQHTVKPWFNGRLNYAPPVTDLEAKGYPLAGGRVDYIDRRIVGVLIYRYQKHPIDLYILPATNGASAPESHATDGYAIARWRQDGMDFWAITDAEPAHLHAFVQAFRASQVERE
ncbi:anti-sigma factor [Cupriavidus pauculus]|uniref:Transcriptional regulator n=1 Tax=Cupriavidus pauculus TaxID=82633 RepID=A0A2N5C5T0_9BURK|nr:anti-sigma factor [Cupriavidus pauculus]PLP97540.1 transcriptional regulator [Cupriavidus pauculus]